ncbi:MAG: zinc ribbon domain-containing protein, partial [Chloroflexi bacterium]|nr:zinc ribbon domain-containing protein [Chloroflexota bacterium]
FYVGQLPNGENGWVEGRHSTLIPVETFEAAGAARARNRNNPAKTTRSDSRVSSLSGVAKCYECGATLRTMRNRGVARMVCNTRLKGGECTQKSARLDRYEDELQHYLDAFTIPEDYREQLLEGQRRLVTAYDDTEAQRSRLHSALDRLKDLYKWGDKTKGEYQRETDEILGELQILQAAPVDDAAAMDKLAKFLRDFSSAWREADQERRNKLARLLFDGVWIKDQAVFGVTPRPELRPFFDLAYAELSKDVLQWRPRPGSNRRSHA